VAFGRLPILLWPKRTGTKPKWQSSIWHLKELLLC
jgi:hypothetical protein